MTPRPIDLSRDMPAVAALLARSRANGGQIHPGGIQWWLREIGREGFEAFVWSDGPRAPAAGFVMIDGDFAIAVAGEQDDGPSRLGLIDWTEQRLASRGKESLMVSLARDDKLLPVLEARGYVRGDVELELMIDIDGEPRAPRLPDGYRFAPLAEIGDDAYVDMHRAAWSDERPSSYRREWHDVVRQMPDFQADLVPIVVAPDGTPAAYCIGWADAVSGTLEIEPLGTHRDFRRRGLALAVVHEVVHRAWRSGMSRVLVWNSPQWNAAAYGLYTSAGMTPRREVVQLTRNLS